MYYNKYYKLLVVFSIIILTFVSVVCGAEDSKHLFILSGQSNMVGLKQEVSFTPVILKEFSEKSVIIVKDAHSGQSIRSWCKVNKEHPLPTKGRIPKVRGNLYGPLMKKVLTAIKDVKLKTVTFVWMQGESDLRNTAYKAYLEELMQQLQKDIKFKDINLVLGRISDCGLNSEKRLKERLNIRKIQVEFIESYPNGIWIDTDDLNNREKDGKVYDDLHYTPEGYKILGERFAKASIELVKKNGFNK